ncbi:bifunctional hydroxymethylpyrimidine kinase/phosphomethylpyrimidine kinase [Proteobacteria bacterium 005FR1]|nr:bifunctional hydroxymethylpyrimidine kinase/phosphomethylpyrimidine kinase [Proteobacteria bacterium 005FR1]
MASQATPIAFTIAGSDPSGGAGLQADLKTFSALGVYGCAAVTALTAQNTRGVSGVWPVPQGSVREQIVAVLEDVPVNAVKLGMLFSHQVISEVIEALNRWPSLPVVCDPVMVATSGDRLLSEDAVDALRTGMLPRSLIITPNTAEAAVLLDCPEATTESEMQAQADQLLKLGPGAVLLKGGHLQGESAPDVLLWRDIAGQQQKEILRSPRIATRNTHGTGCTLAAAIAAGLAKGLELPEAVRQAKTYLSGALAAADQLKIGSGAGPVNHFFKDCQ